MRALSIAVASALLAACTVGPDHVRPTLAVADTFAHAPADTRDARSEHATAAIAAPAPDAAFWTRFDDPLLDTLVSDALVANHDLRIALSRVDRARALLRESRFDALPTVTAQANAQDSRASADQLPGVSRGDRRIESFDAGLVAGWELDLFGRVRRGIESQRAGSRASEADLAAVQVAVVGDLARTYFELRGLQQRLGVAQANADNQAETVRLVQVRQDAGRGTEFDASRARAQLETTRARIPALEAAVAGAMHRIAVLSGRTPESLLATLAPATDLPTLPARIQPDTPGELLRRRPDIAAAEARLHASTARIGVATADLFPRFTLSGLLGSQALDAGALFERDSQTRLVALGIDWSFLDIGRVRARIAASDADASGELARYEQTVLLALEETETALVRYARARVEDGHLERAAVDSASAARLARVRFDAGASDLLEVLDAERTQLQAQDAFVDARTRSVTGAVGVYRALAGGWPTQLPTRVEVATAR